MLVRRAQRLRFMGGAYVFPGGAVAPEDRDPALTARITGSGAHPWPESSGPSECQAYALAAIRESCEEAGLLLGGEASPAICARVREGLLEGAPLLALLEATGIDLDLSSLIPLSRWITPRGQPIRFDTRFYVAVAPRGQIASPDQRESDDLVWRSAEQAVAEHRAGTLRLSPPTFETLDDLSPHASIEAVLAHAGSRPPPTIEPMTQERDGRKMILYPGDPEHPNKVRALRGVTRKLL